MNEPSVLTRMRLSCCWGDNLNEKELNEVVDYINHLQRENKQLQQERDKYKSIIEMVRDIIKKQLLSNTNITKFTDEMCLELIFNKIQELEEGK